MKKKIFSSTVLFTLLISTFVCFMFLFTTSQNTAAAETIVRKNTVLDSYIASMSIEYEVKVFRNTTKQIKDFAGNDYTLVECSPTGYLIYGDSAAVPIEYSANSLSPYINYTTGLYYGGPSFFYVDKGSYYQHTITGQKIDKIFQSKLKNSSVELQSSINLIKNQSNINYISGSKQTGSGVYSSAVDPPLNTFTCVDNYQYFVNLTGNGEGYHMGYMSDGNGLCGYISGNILLGYYDTFKNGAVIPNDTIMSGVGINRYFNNASLTQELYDIGRSIGYDDSLVPLGLYKIIKQYFKNHNLNINFKCVIPPFFSSLTINKAIDNGNPVIIAGSLYDPTSGIIANWINHFVLLYGYKRNPSGEVKNWGYIAHYGWAGYSCQTVNVNVPSTFGGICYVY